MLLVLLAAAATVAGGGGGGGDGSPPTRVAHAATYFEEDVNPNQLTFNPGAADRLICGATGFAETNPPNTAPTWNGGAMNVAKESGDFTGGARYAGIYETSALGSGAHTFGVTGDGLTIRGFFAVSYSGVLAGSGGVIACATARDDTDAATTVTIPAIETVLSSGRMVAVMTLNNDAAVFTGDANTTVVEVVDNGDPARRRYFLEGAPGVSSLGGTLSAASSYIASAVILKGATGGGGGGTAFGSEGYVGVCTDPLTAAGAEWKALADVLDTDYVATTSDPLTAVDAAWKQVSDLVDDDYVALADVVAPGVPSAVAWLQGPAREIASSGDTSELPDAAEASGTLNDDNPMSVIARSGWGRESDNHIAVETSHTDDPVSPPDGIAIDYYATMPGGSSGNLLERAYPGTVKTSWVTFTFVVPSGFDGHPTGINKQIHIWIGGGNKFIMTLFGSGSGPFAIGASVQGCVSPAETHYNSDLSAAHSAIEVDTPYKAVAKVVNNTTGTADGSFKVWLRVAGAWYLICDVTGIQWTASEASWEEAMWNPTWGGTGSAVSVLFKILCLNMKITNSAVRA